MRVQELRRPRPRSVGSSGRGGRAALEAVGGPPVAHDRLAVPPLGVCGPLAREVAGRDRNVGVEPAEDRLHRIEQDVRDRHVGCRERSESASTSRATSSTPLAAAFATVVSTATGSTSTQVIGRKPRRGPRRSRGRPSRSRRRAAPHLARDSASSSTQSRVVACAPVPNARPGSMATAREGSGGASHGGPIQIPATSTAGGTRARRPPSRPRPVRRSRPAGARAWSRARRRPRRRRARRRPRRPAPRSRAARARRTRRVPPRRVRWASAP